MSSTETRIQITQGYAFGVDRTMPVILRNDGTMTKIEWDGLCDRIDSIVQPLNKLRKLRWVFIGLFMIAFVASIIVSWLTLYNSFSKGGIVVFLLPVCAMIGLAASQVYASNRFRNAILDIKTVCEETSKKYYNHLSFHLRDDRIVVGSAYRRNYRAYDDVYILVSIIQQTGAAAIAAATATDIELGYEDAAFANDVNFSSPQADHNKIAVPPMVEATTVAETVAVSMANPATVITTKAKKDDEDRDGSESDRNDESQSIESRLVKLEKIKHMISPSEYEEKKKEILSEI